MSFPPGKQAPPFGAKNAPPPAANGFARAQAAFASKKVAATHGKKKKSAKEAAADKASPFFTKRSDGMPT